MWEKIENSNRTNTTNTVIHRLLCEPDDSTSARVYYFTAPYFYKIFVSSNMMLTMFLVGADETHTQGLCRSSFLDAKKESSNNINSAVNSSSSFTLFIKA